MKLQLQATVIENVRLLDDTRQALEQQNATADILKVIASSPSDTAPVFEAIASSATRLLGGFSTAVFRFDGDTVYLGAFTHVNPEADAMLRSHFPRPVAGFEAARMAQVGRPTQVVDTDNSDDPQIREIGRSRGFRSMLFVPLMNGDIPIGVISLTRVEQGPFAERHVKLLQTFADQAVIAIQNIELFEEVKARTEELSGALAHQTGSANILRVIASSPTDVQPVLDAIVRSACDLCEAYDAVLVLKEEEELFVGSHYGRVPLNRNRWPNDRGTISGRAIVDRRSVHVADVTIAMADFPTAAEMSVRDGGRTVLGIPLMREGVSIGAIVLRRTDVDPFDGKQIALLQTFADQAVIAISNVNLFNQLQAKTRELSEALTYQTGSASILKVIASSPTDVEPVLKAIVESACELCEAYDSVALLREGDHLRFSAHHGPIPLNIEKWPINRKWVSGRAFIDRKPVHVTDLLAEIDEFPDGREFSLRMGHRTILAVPLLRDGESIGSLILRRKEVNPFSDKQIALLQTFADQAVIAIGNVHLFEEVQQRTRELSESLDNLRAAQDRLVQTEKLASLGQLTAGIAHEIKNPLNFVNNFSALSAELVHEMDDALSNTRLEPKQREELDEICRLLKSNLEKVVHHGERADSIVKNMLLHSRQGSGEHQSTDINALVDESLNLAYHGERAGKIDFNITLERGFDPEAGRVDVYPQEITRVLLNLMSNGFYAATERKTRGENGFEMKLTATTRNLGDRVEIRIRDNGTGISDEVKDKIFNPFFTTKPAGEGTGLGLSMSYDIVVKQHRGTIEVETEVGAFTEFRIVLPRRGVQLAGSGARA